MNLLWLCNGMPSHIGWLDDMSKRLANADNINFAVCFPKWKQKSLVEEEAGGVRHYAIPRVKKEPYQYDTTQEMIFQSILDSFKPDIIHIWGTEYAHTLAMVNAAESKNMLDKVVINIQGLCSVIEKHYCEGLPLSVIYGFTLRDFLRQDNIRRQKSKFKKRGAWETEALKKTRHVIGRTEWDLACTKQINPQVIYHHCNESLRDLFYTSPRWSLAECEQHSIFLSQGYYPIKGLHHMLEAMPIIQKQYPGAKIYCAGPDMLGDGGLVDNLRKSSYSKYIRALINKHRLQGAVVFTGNLDEAQFCERMRRSHVFVSPSSIENESNSIGEAMMLGTPCVATFAGGVTSRFRHEIDGFCYPVNASYMLAHYVCRIFNEPELAVEFSKNAYSHVVRRSDRQENFKQLLEIYEDVRGVQEND